MDKQTTLAFVIIGLILIVWLYLNSPAPQPPTTTNDTTMVKDTSGIHQDTAVAKKQTEEPKKTEAPATASKETETSLLNNVEKPEKIITVETDLVKMELTSRGARIRKYYLKNYDTWYHRDVDTSDFYNTHVQLINPKNGGDFNIIFVTKEGKLVNTANLDFSGADNYYYRVSGKDSLVLDYTFDAGEGKIIKKDFKIFGDDYASKVDVELKNMEDMISSYRYDVVWSNGINFVEKNSTDEATQANASAYSGEEQVIVDAKDDGEKVTKDINGKVDWVAVRNKYFAVIVSPDKPSEEGGAYFEGTHTKSASLGPREYYSASLKMPFRNLNDQKDSFTLYMGPIDYNVLRSYQRHFETVFDFGSFFGLRFIIRPISEYILLPLFQFLHRFIPNYGWVIIIFSIIIKFALHPLTRQSYKSMKKMQLLQPKIAELKEKYKDDQQRVQKETMKLYSTYGINPMGGCLPTLLQMPILIALWSLFNVAIDIRQQPFMLWITNLSSPDVIYRLPFKIPLFNIDVISGLALLLGITMFMQQKMSVKDPSQKALVYVMPVMFTAIFMSFPSGLNLYYFMFNVLSIGQQYYINHQKADSELVPVKNPKKKEGFFSRMMEAAEKQAQTQKKSAQKRK